MLRNNPGRRLNPTVTMAKITRKGLEYLVRKNIAAAATTSRGRATRIVSFFGFQPPVSPGAPARWDPLAFVLILMSPWLGVGVFVRPNQLLRRYHIPLAKRRRPCFFLFLVDDFVLLPKIRRRCWSGLGADTGFDEDRPATFPVDLTIVEYLG